MKSQILLIYCVVACYGDLELLLNANDNISNKPDDCVNDLISNDCGSQVSIVLSPSNIKYIPITSNCVTYVVRSFDHNEWFLTTNIYIIYLKSLDLSDWKLKYDEMWNPRAKFIIVISHKVTELILKKVFDKLLQLNLFNVFVILNENHTQVIFTYYPLKKGNCGNKYDKIVKLTSCNDLENTVPTNFEDCTVNVLIKDHRSSSDEYLTSFDQYVLNIMAKKIKIKLKYRFLNTQIGGTLLPNYTMTGTMKYLQNKEGDMVIGGYLLNAKRTIICDAIYVQNYIMVKSLLPCKNQHLWKIALTAFKSDSWLIILNSYIFVVLAISLISHIFGLRINQIRLELLDYFFGHGGNTYFRIKRLRFILTIWVWYTFLITSFYSSSLYSLLTTISHRLMDSPNVSAIANMGLNPCIPDNLRDKYIINYNLSFPGEITDRCFTIENVLETMMTQDDYFTLITEYDYYLYYQNKSRDSDKILHPWTFSPSLVYVQYASKGFYLRDVFQRKVSRFFECGLLQHYFYLHFANITGRQITVHLSTGRLYTVLKLADVRVAFCILIMGYIISFLTFAVEINKYFFRI
ncbi:uncharacterized protein LOC125049690 [Pieris napi]|uniref:uncharacterized protein LOC125049690 n=1 Tax=Pieris napi TaxID=78633 RepID=UPI001FBACCFE|nr:uncharacterized protein LOC125049690 [Pieris napi]